jgi:hypothetical protein
MCVTRYSHTVVTWCVTSVFMQDMVMGNTASKYNKGCKQSGSRLPEHNMSSGEQSVVSRKRVLL